MDHTLSSFPSGLPGSGLLLLRLLLASYVVGAGAAAAALGPGVTNVHDVVIGCYWVMTLLGGVLIATGLLTRVVQPVVALVELAAVAVQPWVSGYEGLVFGSWHAALLATGVAIGLTLLGPGAYSVDASMFGRREIVIRPHARERMAERSAGGLSPAYPGSNLKR
jgi:uncharacterized membrane protein YphA (DoxX/SURF4 family)